jgi:hypothetical protein
MKEQLKLINNNNDGDNLLNSNCSNYEPFDKFNQTLFDESTEKCSLYYLNHQLTFWGPGYRFPSNETYDPVIEINGRKDYCILLVGNSRGRHYAPLIKLFVNLTNSTFYDGCTHSKRSNVLSKECKNILVFSGDNAQEIDDLQYFPTLGCTLRITSSPEWFRIYPENEKSISKCLKENSTNCTVPWRKDIIREYYNVEIRKNLHYIDFTDDFCSNDKCFLNIGNELVTIDGWHYCPGAVLKLWPKFLSFMNGLECGRKFLRK